MRYIPLQVSIPEPCHEKWEEMAPQADGRRHCESCARNLVDFSYMTDREIHKFLSTNDGRICGRWRKDQLLRPIHAEVPKRKGIRAAATVGGLLLATGLGAQTTAEPAIRGDIQIEQLAGEIEIAPMPVKTVCTEKIKVEGQLFEKSGEPIVAASVSILGTSTVVISDEAGRFSLELEAEQSILISYIGFLSQEIPAANMAVEAQKAQLQIVLHEATARLEEPMIMGMMVMPEPQEPPSCETPKKEIKNQEELPLPTATTDSYLSQAELFPNPVDDIIGVKFNTSVPTAVTARLFDIEGELLRVWAPRDLEIGQQEERFGIRYLDMVPGHYYLTLTDQTGVVETRVVIKGR